MTEERANVCVFSPALSLSVTVEAAAGEGAGDELHFHPAGQGFWIARMLRRLGERPLLVAGVGGEAGRVLCALAPAWDVTLRAVRHAEASPAHLHDRRDGRRRELARTALPARDRHEVDELYGRVLERATAAGTCVVTGRSPGDSLPLDFYRRLGADLRSLGVRAIADMHGDDLWAFLAGGPLHTLKVSDADLVEDGMLVEGRDLDARLRALERLARAGAERIVVSSAHGPTAASLQGQRLLAVPPALEPADPRGSGDAMTAGLVVAALRGLDPARTLRVACAAGAANVTRRGLGSADRHLVESLADRVAVEILDGRPT